MRYYIDTEFIEYGRNLELISIGIVCEDGRELYCISNKFNCNKASMWVVHNVIDKLPHPEEHPRLSNIDIKKEILIFIGENIPELWGDYAAYDFVVFSQLMSLGGSETYNSMVDNYPKNYPYYINDLQQEVSLLGDLKLPEQDEETKHIAIEDAKHLKLLYDYLQNYNNEYQENLINYLFNGLLKELKRNMDTQKKLLIVNQVFEAYVLWSNQNAR